MSSRLSFVDEVPGVVGRLLVLAVMSAGAMFIILLASAIGVGHLIAAATIERGRWDPTGLGPGAWRPLALLMGPLLGAAAMFTLVEELAFRGYAIGVIAERWGNAAAVLLTTLAAVMAHLRGSELPGSPGYALVAGEPVWLTGGALGLSDGIAVAASLALVTFLVFRPRRADVRPARV